MRGRLTPSLVISCVALFVALGGTGYAVSQISGKQVRDNSLTTKDVKDRSLLAKDFKRGQVPRGATGPAGPAGPAGPRGETGATGATGTVDTSQFHDKAAADERYLEGRVYETRRDETDFVVSHEVPYHVALECEKGDLLLDGAYRFDGEFPTSDSPTEETFGRTRYELRVYNTTGETRSGDGVHVAATCLEVGGSTAKP